MTGRRQTVGIDSSQERRRHREFFGRVDLLAELDRLCDGSWRWVVIAGGPGCGKSAVMARMLRRTEQRGEVVSHHFVRRGYRGLDRPEVVAGNLADQVEAIFPELADPSAPPESRLDNLLTRASDLLAGSGRRLLLLVDGLDEMNSDHGGRAPLSQFLPYAPPPEVTFLCATRHDAEVLRWLRGLDGSVEVDLDDPRWRADAHDACRQFWRTHADDFNPPLSDDQARQAATASDGNLLHAVKLRDWMAARPGAQITALPRGLNGMLDRVWEDVRELDGDLRGTARRALGLWCAAAEPLPLPVMAELAELDLFDLEDLVMNAVRPFLLAEQGRDEGDVAYRPFHESLRAHVAQKLGSRRMAEHHRRLADRLARWPADDDDPFAAAYAASHALTHKTEAGDRAGAVALCRDISFLAARCRLTSVDTLEADLAQYAHSDPEVNDIHRAVRAQAHHLRKQPDALPSVVYNRLRCFGLAPDQIVEALSFDAEPSGPRLRHPVRGDLDAAFTLEGHLGEVLDLAATADGNTLVSTATDGTVRVWDLSSGRCLRTLRGHRDYVWCCDVTADGHTAVSGSADGTIRVWDISTGKCRHTLEGHLGVVWNLAMVGDGTRAVSVSGDSTARVWDLSSGQCLHTLDTGGAAAYRGNTVTDDGNVGVEVWPNGTVQVWDRFNGRLLNQLPYGRGPTWSSDDGRVSGVLVWSDSFQTQVVASGHKVSVWDGHTKSCLRTVDCMVYPPSLRACAVTSDGNTAITVGNDAKVRVWDICRGTLVDAFVEPSGQRTLRCWLTPDDRRVVCLRRHGLTVWDLAEGAMVHSLDDHPKRPATGHALKTEPGETCHSMRDTLLVAGALSPDGRLALAASANGSVGVWDLVDGQRLHVLQARADEKVGCAFLPDGDRAVTTGANGVVSLWDVWGGVRLRSFAGHAASASACAVGPEGTLVFTGSADHTVRAWEILPQDAPIAPRGHRGPVTCCEMIADQDRAITLSTDGALRAWDLQTGAPGPDLPPDNQASALALSPDRRFAATAAADAVRLWDAVENEPLAAVPWRDDAVTCLALGPDARFALCAQWPPGLLLVDMHKDGRVVRKLATANIVRACAATPRGDDAVAAVLSAVVVWDLASGQNTTELSGHTDDVVDCVVSPDGRRVVSASTDHTLRVWDLVGRRCLHILEGHTGPVLCCAVTPDGRTVVSGGADRTVRSWDLASGRLLSTTFGHGRFCSVAADRDTICAGDELGDVWILDRHAPEPSTRAEPTGGGEPIVVYFSYAEADRNLRDALAAHLKLMERRGIIRTWHDRCVAPGAERAEEVDRNLEQADIILMLVSADFLASDYCWEMEVERAMERHLAGQATVVPIIVRPVAWQSAPFGRCPALPEGGKPVTRWPDRDEAWLAVSIGIREAVARRRKQRT